MFWDVVKPCSVNQLGCGLKKRHAMLIDWFIHSFILR